MTLSVVVLPARRTQQGEELPLPDVEGDVVDRADRRATAAVVELLDEIADLDCGCGHGQAALYRVARRAPKRARAHAEACARSCASAAQRPT
jgi:predicted deacylase